ncbi:plasmid stabilization protein [Rhizobium sp. S152]|uniref:FitA-like ribbon-helix-helix domain-containing protein n=1 Tax=Rhizobium sp. S152 TaxID=3055038 RepID=UPI0025A9F05B|nr:plasmid stabilization protein [Rhizobium sp. S152]MDM9626187.1 plasmid stabilization protein [Rhizobium sp. S152]
MGDLLIRNISDAMKRDIALRAEKNGNSLSDEAKNLLQKAMVSTPGTDAPARSALDGFREIFSPLTDDEREEFAKIMDDIEAERKKDFGRPLEGFD